MKPVVPETPSGICAFCKRKRCNRFYRIPVGSPIKRIVTVCGNCVIRNAQRLREWLGRLERGEEPA